MDGQVAAAPAGAPGSEEAGAPEVSTEVTASGDTLILADAFHAIAESLGRLAGALDTHARALDRLAAANEDPEDHPAPGDLDGGGIG